MTTVPPTILQMCPFSPYMESELAVRGSLVHWYRLSAAEQTEWLKANADKVRAVVTGGHIGIPATLIPQLTQLAIIAINGVGFDKVDVNLAASQNAYVSTTPDLLTDDVADLGVGLIISLLRRLPAADSYVRTQRWLQGEMPLANKVSGRRFGILGLGKIGTALAKRLSAFGPVHYTSQTRKPVDYHFHASVSELASAVDVLVIASAANAATRHLVNAAVLEKLGPQGYLINVSRGAIVDEAALVAALVNGTIAGAALDVFEDEPRVPAALCNSDKVVLAPHIGSATMETRKAMADLVLANVDAGLAGTVPPTALRSLQP
jgi:lactate dehydrogenase-like 2-hydroxyacid dehydrogenase